MDEHGNKKIGWDPFTWPKESVVVILAVFAVFFWFGNSSQTQTPETQSPSSSQNYNDTPPSTTQETPPQPQRAAKQQKSATATPPSHPDASVSIEKCRIQAEVAARSYGFTLLQQGIQQANARGDYSTAAMYMTEEPSKVAGYQAQYEQSYYACLSAIVQ